MNQKKVSINGLQNIGKLLGRADAPKEAPKRERRDLTGILHHTSDKVHAALPLGAAMGQKDPHRALINTYLHAGLRDAYALGHAEALEQNSSVERLLEKQYEARTRVTTPAVVCAIMEQSGLSSMTLDMVQMATVFQRCDIDYVYNPDTEVMEYTMRPAGASTEGPLAVPFTEHPEEIDPTDPRDELGELDPSLAFDHETEDDRPTEMITPNERLSRGVL
jgi:hypothetical protein